ncbi:MAG: hypothetical protein AAFY03_07865, partial [Pseudomonadota bacterium]
MRLGAKQVLWPSTLVLLLVGWSAVTEESASLLSNNPALMELHINDPLAAEEALSEIKELMEKPYNRQILVPIDSQSETFEILQENPALAEIHRRDPKATAKLLSII